MYTTSIVLYHAISPLVASGVDVKELVLVAAGVDVKGLVLVILGVDVSFVFPVLKYRK